MKKHINITIEGKLKEKDFNYYCQTGAIKFNIDAIYTNGNDKDIYVEAEGEPENLHRYIEYLEFGPISRHLISFKTDESEIVGIKGFTSYRRHVNAKRSLLNTIIGRFTK